MSTAGKDHLKATIARLLQARAHDLADGCSGRGLVICAGGPRMLTNAYVLIRLLRDHLRCRLPIEVWHLGAREMPALMADALADLGCAVIDAERVKESFPAQVHDGWQLKIYALARSSFAEALLLDADQVPVRDPAEIFDWHEFRETGAVFWPDAIALAAENPVWALLGLAGRAVMSWESGQVLLDKRRHARALAIALCLAEHAETIYDLIYGEKDMFLLAWMLTGADHALIPHPPFVGEGYFGQRDFEGRLLFQHRANAKWSLGEAPSRPEGFLWQAECEAILEDLRGFWNGRDFSAPPRSIRARAREGELVAQGRFLFLQGEQDPCELRLLAGHQIGLGRSYRITNWHVEEAGDGIELVLHDWSKPSYRLRGDAAGPWQGRSTTMPQVEVVLEAIEAPSVPSTGALQARGLADDLMDAALVPVPGSTPDVADLAAALRLIARIEPGIAHAVARRADRLALDFPALSEALRAIAEELAGEERAAPDVAPRRTPEMLRQADRYEKDGR